METIRRKFVIPVGDWTNDDIKHFNELVTKIKHNCDVDFEDFFIPEKPTKTWDIETGIPIDSAQQWYDLFKKYADLIAIDTNSKFSGDACWNKSTNEIDMYIVKNNYHKHLFNITITNYPKLTFTYFTPGITYDKSVHFFRTTDELEQLLIKLINSGNMKRTLNNFAVQNF